MSGSPLTDGDRRVFSQVRQPATSSLDWATERGFPVRAVAWTWALVNGREGGGGELWCQSSGSPSFLFSSVSYQTSLRRKKDNLCLH